MTRDERRRLRVLLDYLRLEMSIMGVLSAFAAVAVGLVLGEVMSAEDGPLGRAWDVASLYVMAGSGELLLAALFFYKQRSTLAWYFGQIALVIAYPSITRQRVTDLLEGADEWDSWWEYHVAFSFLSAALVTYGTGLVALDWAWFSAGLIPLVLIASILALALSMCVLWRTAEKLYPYEAWSAFKLLAGRPPRTLEQVRRTRSTRGGKRAG